VSAACWHPSRWGPSPDHQTEPGASLRGRRCWFSACCPGAVSRALLLVQRLDSTDPGADPDGTDEAQPDDEVMPSLPWAVVGLTGLVAMGRHLFNPPPGSFAARLLVFQRTIRGCTPRVT
jgi:hypothetical protein